MLLYYLCACKEYSCLFVHALFVDCIDIGIDLVIRLCVILIIDVLFSFRLCCLAFFQIIDGFTVKHTRDSRETAAYLTLMTRYLQSFYQVIITLVN